MTAPRLLLKIFRGDTDAFAQRRMVTGVDVDTAKSMAAQWARSENQKNPDRTPFVRYVIIDPAGAAGLPVTVGEGRV